MHFEKVCVSVEVETMIESVWYLSRWFVYLVTVVFYVVTIISSIVVAQTTDPGATAQIYEQTAEELDNQRAKAGLWSIEKAHNKETVANTPKVIQEIRDRYQVCRQLRADKVGMMHLYGVYTDLEKQERPVWQHQEPKEGMVLSEAIVFIQSGQIGFAELLETTPSFDWSKNTEYCYHTDGTLAFVFSSFRTTYGNVRVDDRLYFDRNGRKIRTIRRIFDLNSGRRLPDDTNNFHDRETQIFIDMDAFAEEVAL